MRIKHTSFFASLKRFLTPHVWKKTKGVSLDIRLKMKSAFLYLRLRDTEDPASLLVAGFEREHDAEVRGQPDRESG